MIQIPFISNNNQPVLNLGELPEKTNKVFLSNHVSWEDLSILNSTLPKEIHFVVFNSEEQGRNEKLATTPNRKVTVFSELDAVTINKTVELIESGEPVLLFPENKVSSNGNLMRIYPELAYIVFKSKALAYPLFINGAENTKSSPSKIRFNKLIAPKPSVTIGEAFTLSELTDNNGKNSKERMAHIIFEKLSNLKFEVLNKTNINLYNELLTSAKAYNENAYILKDGSSTMTYKKLLVSVQIMASKLKMELNEEKRVGVLLPTSIGNILTLFSLFKNSISPAILNFTMGEQNLLDCCETAEIKTIITSRLFIEKGNLQPLLDTLVKEYRIIYLEDIKEQISGKDMFNGIANSLMSQKASTENNEIILFTSGSESKPKGVILTHDNIFANIQQALVRLDLKQDDTFLSTLPMFHSFGLTVCTFLPLLVGIPVYLHPSPIDYKIIPELVYQEDATIILGTPTFLNGYAKNAHPYAFRSLRYAIAGAEKLKDETREIWAEKFGIRILEGYGATEAAPVVSINTPIYNKKGSVGQLLPGMELKVEAVDGIESGGRLLIKGPNIMKGYLIHKKGFVPQNEWYDTGDVVEVDENNFIEIKSRLKRFAKIGGEMVSLNSVEEIAYNCFGHDNFSAISIPDKRKGERIYLLTTDSGASLKNLKKYYKLNKLSSLLLPTKLEIVEEIPLLGSGKTDYVSLQNLYSE